MKITRLLNDYTNTGEFNFVYKNQKLNISYYDELVDFTDNKVVVIGSNNKVICKGNSLTIESLFKDLITIKGNIKTIDIGVLDE